MQNETPPTAALGYKHYRDARGITDLMVRESTLNPAHALLEHVGLSTAAVTALAPDACLELAAQLVAIAKRKKCVCIASRCFYNCTACREFTPATCLAKPTVNDLLPRVVAAVAQDAIIGTERRKGGCKACGIGSGSGYCGDHQPDDDEQRLREGA